MMPRPTCPFCKEAELEIKERYPKAMLDMLKDPYLACPKCGYKASGDEMKAYFRGLKG